MTEEQSRSQRQKLVQKQLSDFCQCLKTGALIAVTLITLCVTQAAEYVLPHFSCFPGPDIIMCLSLAHSLYKLLLCHSSSNIHHHLFTRCSEVMRSNTINDYRSVQLWHETIFSFGRESNVYILFYVHLSLYYPNLPSHHSSPTC